MAVTQRQAPCRSSAVDALDYGMESPVFILGLHRSGTTLLYEMLAKTGHWNTLWALHVACYDRIVADTECQAVLCADFSQRLAAAGMETRGVDAVKASPETKEEYGFILDNKGLGSQLTQRTLPMFQEICRTISSAQSEPRPLLMKNPWDFGNAHTIRRLIPAARFVYIHRHPLETINSMWRFLHDAFHKPNPYMAMLSARYQSITQSPLKMAVLRNLVGRFPGMSVDGLIWWFGRQCDRYLQSSSRVPESDRVEITYDDLCTDPNGTMALVREKLDIADNGFDYSQMISRRTGRCDSRVVSKTAKIERRTADYLVRIEQMRRNEQLRRP